MQQIIVYLIILNQKKLYKINTLIIHHYNNIGNM